MEYPSKIVEKAVEELSALPGIGKKTALRLALSLIKRDKDKILSLSRALESVANNLCFCKTCYNVSDDDVCYICSSNKRDNITICIVEDFRDVMAIESTMQYKGVYHVLGGLISPLDGIGPENLTIEALLNRIASHQIKELIFALSATIQGDTTTFYLSNRLKDKPIILSTLSRGIAIGGELEYADEITLGKSILARIPYLTNNQ